MSRVLTAPATTRWSAAATLATCAVLVCTATAVPTSAGASPGTPSGTRSAIRPGSHSDFAGGKWGDADGRRRREGRLRQQRRRRQDPGSLYTVEKAIGARGVVGQEGRRTGSSSPGRASGVARARLRRDPGARPRRGRQGDLRSRPVHRGERRRSPGQDTFGHGTFMAGIIAGRGADNPSSDLPPAHRPTSSSAWRRTPSCSRSSWPPATAAPTSARSSPPSTGSPSTRCCPTAPVSASSTSPTARTRRRTTSSTRSRPRPRTPGSTASSSSPRPATTALRDGR